MHTALFFLHGFMVFDNTFDRGSMTSSFRASRSISAMGHNASEDMKNEEVQSQQLDQQT